SLNSEDVKDSDDPPILEAKVIENLREVEALDEAAKLYLEAAPERLENIRIALAKPDAPELRSSAHSLKSISGTLGAIALYNICQELENIGRRADETGTSLPPEALGIFAAIEAEYEKVRAALELEIQK
ncbi:MAG: Hpt domain-containing protein, partial [Okeania sp. SIO2H7]|nr:Hpt domain-containing protein [Okeania sp. SIO2H7]